MVVRKSARREVRLDEEHDRRLEEELRQRDITFAAWIREQIDRNADEKARAQRLAAVERLASLNLDFGWDPSEPEPATRLIDDAYDEAIMSQFSGG